MRWDWRIGWWLAVLLALDAGFLYWRFGGCRQTPEALPAAACPRENAVPQASGLVFGFPTAQTNLCASPSESVFMPTASGRLASALYGSVRTINERGRIRPSFHEGIDIAPLIRDRRGRARDPIMASAAGTVAYVNRHAGQSNYGIYIVLEHDDPVGPIYSLYAHLQDVERALRPGAHVARGQTLGIMGNTPVSIIPPARAHLHFEVGLILNRRFSEWAAARNITNPHGNGHGWNLSGIDPLAVFSDDPAPEPFSMGRHLRTLNAAFDLWVQSPRPMDYFVRYPSLWEGEGNPVGPMVLSVSEGGVIIRGRHATPDECDPKNTSGAGPRVLNADPDVLGRNGRRLIDRKQQGRWQLTANGRKWLEIMLH